MKAEDRQHWLSLRRGQQLPLSVVWTPGDIPAWRGGGSFPAEILLRVYGIWGKERQFYLRVQPLICDQAPVDGPSLMSISAKAKIRKGRKW